jgi:DNA-nicking Smr family endonuclease
MAKKDRPPKKSNNPFSTLRGFAVSAPVPPPRPAPTPVTDPSEQEDLFAQEMNRLGVKPSAPNKSTTPKPATEKQTSIPVDDLALFLDALGEMASVLADDAEDETGEIAAPVEHLAREAQRGRVIPEDVLDLHGFSRAEALVKVAWFVDNALYQGCRYLLVITGRGRQSGEAVLREAVEGWLRSEESRGVREWCRAPARLGGQGALLLALKKKG